ncbi:hypothetical protein N7453_006689 [Penicillium expansum]|nr:hypothetical protein N7453_006689 [Penicillium expansum]
MVKNLIWTIIKTDFDLPPTLQAHLESIDSFIHSTILPLQHSDDNDRFFDHRRKARTLADYSGFYRFALPGVYGGQSHPDVNSWMSAIRYHLSSNAAYGGVFGLANDLQNEHSIVGNFPDILMLHHFGSQQQRDTLIPARLQGSSEQHSVLLNQTTEVMQLSCLLQLIKFGKALRLRGQRSGRQGRITVPTFSSLRELLFNQDQHKASLHS